MSCISFATRGMITRCANDVAEPGQLYGGMRLLKKPGELPHNS